MLINLTEEIQELHSTASEIYSSASKTSRLMRYLVRVSEFTDLSGNQVSLVVLHLHGVDVLLTRAKERKENKQTKPSPFSENE